MTKLPAGLRLNPNEELVYVLRTHPKVMFVPVLIQLLLTAAMVATWMFVPAHLGQGWVQRGTAIAVGVAMLHYAVWPFLQWRARIFIVTTRQIRVQEGVLKRRTHSSQLSRISDIQCERGILDRIFRCGTIVIVNAANTHGGDSANVNRIVFSDVPGALDVEHRLKEMVFDVHIPDAQAA